VAVLERRRVAPVGAAPAGDPLAGQLHLARGLPTGSNIEYANRNILADAISFVASAPTVAIWKTATSRRPDVSGR
jgi:hypothetical protein